MTAPRSTARGTSTSTTSRSRGSAPVNITNTGAERGPAELVAGRHAARVRQAGRRHDLGRRDKVGDAAPAPRRSWARQRPPERALPVSSADRSGRPTGSSSTTAAIVAAGKRLRHLPRARRRELPVPVGDPVVTGTTNDYQAALSPDGTRLCFTRDSAADKDIFVAPVGWWHRATARGAPAPSIEYECAWSPDGQQIAFVRGAFGAGQILMRSSTRRAPWPASIRSRTSPAASTATPSGPTTRRRRARTGLSRSPSTAS